MLYLIVGDDMKYVEQIPFFEHARRNKKFNMQAAHSHKKHELYFLEKGNTKYFIGSELYLLSPGELVFVPKGIFHKTNSDECREVERILLSFDDELVGKEYTSYIEELKNNKYIRLSADKILIVQELLQKIEKEINCMNKGYLDMQKLYLRELLIFLCRHRKADKKPEYGSSYSIIQNAARYISNNCNCDLSLDTLSVKYAMSPGHFSKQFKSITGIGLSEYINIVRVTAAEKLLKSTNKTITQIATECGFNDSNYFAAVFKKIKGITPKKYSLLYKERK